MNCIIKLLFAAGVVTAALTSRADTITWNGSVSSSWLNPTNWTPQEVPTTNDHVIISSGSVTVPSTGTFAILDWSGGTITGPLTVISNAVLNLSWSVLTSWNGALTNAGTVNITGAGQLNMSGGPINNLPGGIIDFKASPTWTGLSPIAFYNAGLVRKTAGAGSVQLGITSYPVNFTNTGTVEADIGTITFNSGGPIDGNYQATNGATINFALGAFTPGTNPVLSGNGTIKFTGTTLALPTNVIPGLQLLAGTLNLGPAFQGGSITNLTLAGTILNGTNILTGTLTSGSGGFSGALTVAGGGIFNWTGGGSIGPITVLTNGVMNISWSALTTWNGALTNGGIVNITGGGQLNMSSGPINNLPGGIIDFQVNDNWTGLTPLTLYNAGLLRKTAGTGNTQFGLPSYPVNFINAGTVEADTGTITFNSGGQIDGSYEAANNATINFALGAFTVGSPIFSGAGTNKFTGTSLTLLNNLIPGLQLPGGLLNLGPAFQSGTITNLSLPGITLAGTNTITGTASLGGGFTGVLTVASNAVITELAGISQGALFVAGGATVNWTNSGTYTGSLTVLTNGILNIDWNQLTTMAGSLTNGGLVNVHGSGQLNLMSGPINNLPGGIIDFKTNQMWTGFPATFYNAGLLRKTGGTGMTQFGLSGYPINFTNTGTVEADIGTITFNSGGQIDGNYQAFGNGTINFAAGTFTAINPVFSGTGTNKFTGTILILANNIVPGLQLLGGTVNVGPGFQGGSITNLVLPGIALAGTNTITGTATLGAGFTGVLTVASNGVANGQGGTSVGSLIVAGGGTFNWSNGPIGNSITVLANGVLNISWNVLTYLNGSLTNAGLVTVTGSGQLNLDAGPINNLASGIIDFKTNSVWTGFPAVFYNAGLVRKTGGAGTSQIGYPSYPISFFNTGTVEADTGTINFNVGGYSDTSSAHISISLGGATSGTGYGLIRFTAPPLLNASLAATVRNGFVPGPGQTFNVLAYPSSTNQFNCIGGLDLGGGILLQPQFSSTGLTLLTTAYSVDAVRPQLFINRSLGGVAITWPASFSSWTLQSATNLSSPAWIPVPNSCGNEALVPGTAPLYFRLGN